MTGAFPRRLGKRPVSPQDDRKGRPYPAGRPHRAAQDDRKGRPYYIRLRGSGISVSQRDSGHQMSPREIDNWLEVWLFVGIDTCDPSNASMQFVEALP